MIPSLLITLRETLEAALIICIVFSYLKKTNQQKYYKAVTWGALTGVALSIIGAAIFEVVAGGFTGKAEELFEGVTMLIGAALLTTMILWMMKQSRVAENIEKLAKFEINKYQQVGIFGLILFAVLREGIETVIFLKAVSFTGSDHNFIGALLGIGIAILLSYLVFISSMKINLQKFFTITSIILILFAAGLVAHGVHELQEAGALPIVNEHLWDINPPIEAEGVYPLLHEKGNLGSIAKGLFGYNGDPSLIEVLSYVFYIVLTSILWYHIKKSKKAGST